MIPSPDVFRAASRIGGALCASALLVFLVWAGDPDEKREVLRLSDPNRAASEGDLESLREIVRKNPAVIHEMSSARSLLPLHSAALGNQPEIVVYLLEQGADVNARDRSGYTALHFAAKTCAVEAAKALLQAGADPRPQPAHRYKDGVLWQVSVLELAASHGDPEFVKLLLDRGAPVEYGDGPNRHSTLRWACFGPRCPRLAKDPAYAANGKIIELLVEHGADLNFRDVYRWTPLMVAAARGRAETVEFLLDCYPQVDLEALDKDGNTALHLAVGAGLADVKRMPYGAKPAATIRVLLKHGARRDATNHAGHTPWELAKALGDPEVIKAFAEDFRQRGGSAD